MRLGVIGLLVVMHDDEPFGIVGVETGTSARRNEVAAR